MNTIDLTAAYVMPTYGRQPIAIARGDGSWLWDEDGKKYLDFCTGIAVCALGHCHPAMQAALTGQAATLWHASNLYHLRGQAELAGFIVDEVMRLPGKVFFSNSGAEANDGLIKAARKFGHARPMPDGTPRTLVLTFNQSFHGRTLGGIAATGQAKVKDGFDPMLPGFRHLPFNDLDAAAAAMAGGEVAAVLVEPIQGEGGVNVASAAFLRGLRDLCRAHDALLFFDEVQCGMGRLGEWRGWDALPGMDDDGLDPDGVSWAKGMGGGFPIGGFWLGNRPVGGDTPLPLHDILGPGSHGSTYGGSPLASAVGLAVLKEIQQAGLLANTRRQGARLRDGVLALGSPMVCGVRGAGLLLGIALDPDVVQASTTLPPGPTPAMRVVTACRDHGLLVPPAGNETIRLLPPLNVSAAECEAALRILKSVLV